MSEQSQTTADTPSETQLCKMGCGFFGSTATGGCCSKCWRDVQKNKQGKAQGSASTCTTVSESKRIGETGVESSKPTPMDVDTVPREEAVIATEPVKQVSNPVDKTNTGETPKKRKKKKASYKNMMKGIMHSNIPERDVEKEKESLRKVTGGGTFTKIDKI